ncbi:MAG: hypothetical protein QXE79_02725 [Candidatus Bathyarchaeia archaeon]
MLYSTVIGSLPRLSDDLSSSIALAVDLQLRYGIDVISDGEQRTDMIGYFSDLPGISISQGDGGPYIAGRVRPPRDPSETFKMRDLKIALNRLRGRGFKVEGLKLSVTGPVTLAFTCAAKAIKTDAYRGIGDPSLYLDVAEALNPIILEALACGALVQVDEPGISAGYLNPRLAVEAVNMALKDVGDDRDSLEKLSLHVCGDLTGIPDLLFRLLNVKVGCLSLAFAGRVEKANRMLPLAMMGEGGRLLGVGCVSVGAGEPDMVETVGEAARIVHLVSSGIGLEKIRYIHPDCGLRSTPLKVAERILDITAKTAKTVRGD